MTLKLSAYLAIIYKYTLEVPPETICDSFMVKIWGHTNGQWGSMGSVLTLHTLKAVTMETPKTKRVCLTEKQLADMDINGV